MVTAPVVVLLYDRTFLAGSFGRGAATALRPVLGLGGNMVGVAAC